jgi:hypothetical protein
VVEYDQFVTFAAFGRDVPAFQRNAAVRREIDVPPAGHPMIVWGLMEDAPQRFDDIGHCLDLGVVLFGNGLELLEGACSILSLESPLMGVTFCPVFW